MNNQAPRGSKTPPNDPQTNNQSEVGVPRIVRLLAKWNEEIDGWQRASDIARDGGEIDLAGRNYARAYSMRCCVDDLRRICETNDIADTATTI